MAPYKSDEKAQAVNTFDDHQTMIQLCDMKIFSFGAFSNVYKGVCEAPSLTSREEIVVKKTWTKKRADNTSEASEAELPYVIILKTLNRLKHKNIVRLLYYYTKEYDEGSSCLSLVFEFISMNLYQYLKQYNRKIPLIEIKMFSWQLFRGQFHLLRMNICHRDIKPQNLLVNTETGVLKISDFGSSALQPKSAPQPSYHITRYYRPPELLLGSKNYGCEVDVWSTACVFGEMLRSGILFPGHTTVNQVELIFDALGKPTSEEREAMDISSRKWKEMGEGYKSRNGSCSPISNFKALLSGSCPDEAIRLLSQMLVYTPTRRLCGIELLTDPFFSQLFTREAGIRANGRAITCLSKKDLDEVRHGDVSATGTTESKESAESARKSNIRVDEKKSAASRIEDKKSSSRFEDKKSSRRSKRKD